MFGRSILPADVLSAVLEHSTSRASRLRKPSGSVRSRGDRQAACQSARVRRRLLRANALRTRRCASVPIPTHLELLSARGSLTPKTWSRVFSDIVGEYSTVQYIKCSGAGLCVKGRLKRMWRGSAHSSKTATTAISCCSPPRSSCPARTRRRPTRWMLRRVRFRPSIAATWCAASRRRSGTACSYAVLTFTSADITCCVMVLSHIRSTLHNIRVLCCTSNYGEAFCSLVLLCAAL